MLEPPDALDLPALVVFAGMTRVIAHVMDTMQPCMQPGWNSDMSVTVTGFSGVLVYGYTESSGDGFLHAEAPEDALALLDEAWPGDFPCRQRVTGRRIYQLWGSRARDVRRPGDPALPAAMARLARAA
jgi:hypothetical protein